MQDRIATSCLSTGEVNDIVSLVCDDLQPTVTQCTCCSDYESSGCCEYGDSDYGSSLCPAPVREHHYTSSTFIIKKNKNLTVAAFKNPVTLSFLTFCLNFPPFSLHQNQIHLLLPLLQPQFLLLPLLQPQFLLPPQVHPRLHHPHLLVQIPMPRYHSLFKELQKKISI